MSSVNRDGLIRLLRLMTETEKHSFKAEFNLAEKANDDEIIKAIENLPQYEAVRAFIRAGDPTIVLLREIFEIIETFGIATKTTGCVFVLANPSKPDERTELSFSQQTVGAVCTWPARKKWSRVYDSLSELLSTWMSFKPVWQALLRKAEPIIRHELDIVESYIQRENKYQRHERVDENAQQVLRHFMERVQHMEDRLKEIPDRMRPEEIKRILDDVEQLKKAVTKCSNEPRYRYRSRQNQSQKSLDKSVVERYTRRDFATDFDKFLEDVYTLADLIRGKGIVDMLKIDIWSTRPQLFEVWVLLKIMSWIRERGYTINLMMTENVGEQSPFRWNLSYSKASKPCAAVRDAQTGEQRFLFYQLYRPSGNMPDISLLESSDPSSLPIWSVDPKHSEKCGYSRSKYQESATRYRDSFGAKLSLIVEYFDRPTLGDTNPIEFDHHTKLIRGCRPDGSGLPVLFKELSEYHPVRSHVLVCIDFSSSFSQQRDSVLERLRQSHKSGLLTHVMSQCICFAGSTTTVGNFDKWLISEHSPMVSQIELTDGTASGPLLSAISDLKERTTISEILIITDGKFDIPIESLTNQIQDGWGITVRLVSS